MFKYRNTATGRVLDRPKEDEWLEMSSGWERVDDVPEPEEPSTDTSDYESGDPDERNDD